MEAALVLPTRPRAKGLPLRPRSKTRLVLLSDTHGYHHQLTVPDGDIVVHAGDFGSAGKVRDVQDFARWFEGLPHAHKVVVAGNHDRCLELDMSLWKQIFRTAHYLCDREAIVGGLRFYGSPWQPEFNEWSFNLPRGGDQLREVWSRIPDGLDVLVTHGPPYGILDECPGDPGGVSTGRIVLPTMKRVGCELLLDAVKRARPRLHVFGHIHHSYGQHHDPELGTSFVNACTCTEGYDPKNPPIVFDLPERGKA